MNPFGLQDYGLAVFLAALLGLAWHQAGGKPPTMALWLHVLHDVYLWFTLEFEDLRLDLWISASAPVT